MATTKLKWKVMDAPTGRYRSFERRGWPSASFGDDEAAFHLTCEDDYRPADVKTGNHKEINIRVADRSEQIPGSASFTWKKLKKCAKTLDEAKHVAQEFFDAHPSVFGLK
jgi:hypothetical protein